MSDVVQQRKAGLWVPLATLTCFLFGLALILNIQPVGDGLWFWYATAIRDHQHLYSDLHLNQQPLFVLLTAAFQSVFGLSWLASKILPALQLALYCLGLAIVSTFIPWRSWQRALLVVAAFGLTITTPFYRFDDYHVTTQIFQVCAACLLLWASSSKPVNALAVAAGLGIVGGMATGNRLNDGAALLLASGLALLVLAEGKRLLASLVLTLSAAITLLVLIALTHDPVSMWLLETVTHASRIKGGSGGILHSVLAFPVRLAVSALQPKGLLLLIAVLAFFALFARFPRLMPRGHRVSSVLDGAFLAFLIAVQALFLWQGSRNLADAKLGQFLALLALLLGLLVHGWMLRSLLTGTVTGSRRQVLLLIPFWGLVAAAMTSGFHLPDHESTTATLLLFLPLATPWPLPAFKRMWLRRGWLVVASLIIVGGLPAKILVPYDWHHYHADPLFEHRVWYRHPVYGPMYIERAQLDFMLPLCRSIAAAATPPQLLAMPYPYPNYFCAVPPWHGYIQTWYDTASRAEIEGLGRELAEAPPASIVYQRGLDTMALHELSYTAGRPLAQRDLDTQIMNAVALRHWTVVSRSCFDGSDWMLLRTTPPTTVEHQPSPADAADRTEACKASEIEPVNRHF